MCCAEAPVGSCIAHVSRVSFLPPASCAEAGLLLAGYASVGVLVVSVPAMLCIQHSVLAKFNIVDPNFSILLCA